MIKSKNQYFRDFVSGMMTWHNRFRELYVIEHPKNSRRSWSLFYIVKNMQCFKYVLCRWLGYDQVQLLVILGYLISFAYFWFWKYDPRHLCTSLVFLGLFFMRGGLRCIWCLTLWESPKSIRISLKV